MIRGAANQQVVRLGPGQVRLHGTSPRLLRSIQTAFQPAAPDPNDADADVVLEVSLTRHLTPPAGAEHHGDAGDGIRSAANGAWLWWRNGGGWAAVAPGLTPARLALDAGDPAWRHMPVIRSVARRSLPAVGAVAVHASLVEVDGAGILISGWSESGKTEVGLALAAAFRGRLAGDKWVVVSDGLAWSVPGAAGLRGWVVPYLEDSLARLSRVQRARLGSERMVEGAMRIVAHAQSIHPVTDVLGQPFARLLPLVPTVRRAPERILATPASGLSDPTSGPIPLKAAFLLLGSEGPAALHDLGRDAILERILLTTQHEEDLVLDLATRASYGGVPWFAAGPARAALASAFADVPLRAFTTAFPADPRRAAALLTSVL